MSRPTVISTIVLSFLAGVASAQSGPRFEITYAAAKGPGPFDGRLLLLVSTDPSEEPRRQISDTGLKTQLVFGIDVDGWRPGQKAVIDNSVLGFPLDSLKDVPAGS